MSCTGNYEKLNQAFNSVNGELSQLKNPYRPTFTQRDAYVGVGGVALGVAGIWVCQKMLGITKRSELEKKVKTLEETIAATSESLTETDKTVGFVKTIALNASEKSD